MPRTTSALIAAVATGALIAGSALAGPPLPPSLATYTLSVAYDPAAPSYTNQQEAVGTYLSVSDPANSYGFASAATNANAVGDGPSASVDTLDGATAVVDFTYSWEVAGPGSSVLVDLSGYLDAFGQYTPDNSGGRGPEVIAAISGTVDPIVASLPSADVYSATGFYAEGCANFLANCPAGADFGHTAFNVELLAPTDQAETITLLVSGGDYEYGEQFSGDVDPILSIDPSVLDLSDYAISVSPDVQNGYSSVTEPGSWTLMILGAAAVGASCRRCLRTQDARR